MEKWESADNYIGEDFSECFVLISKTRDSDVLTRSNFEAAQKRIEAVCDEDKSQWISVSFGHWACGYIDAIMIHEKACHEVFSECGKIESELENYPVLDEELYSKMEYEYALDTWQSMPLRCRFDLCKENSVSVFASRHDDTFPMDLYDALTTV